MTDMTREDLISNLKEKFSLSEDATSGVDLIGKEYALVVVMESEEMTDEVISRLQSASGRKKLKRMVAIPPKATVMADAREKLHGTGFGIIDGRGFVIKPFSWTDYRSVSIDATRD